MTITLLFAGLLMQPTSSLTIVPRIPTDGVNRHYVGNRAPLAPTSMIKLPVGSVRPKGWLLEQLKRQRDGMTGHLPELSPWLEKEGSAWFDKDGKGKYGWEEVPYWLKGYANLGVLLDDQEIQDEAKVWLEGAIVNQRANGDFGPDHRLGNGTKDHWGNMLMLQCLQSYFEHSGDKRVIELMTRYFKYQNGLPEKDFLTDYWEHARGGDNLASIYWLYNRTGDRFLLEFAEKNHRRTLDWTNSTTLPDWHNVNVAQSFDEPAIYAQQSLNPLHTRAAYRNFDLIRQKYGQVPGGMFGADENAREGHDDPRQATETCGFVEQMQSDEELLRITGDPAWADHCENVAFNSYPAAVMPDFRSLRYLTAPNMVVSDAQNHAPGYANAGPFTVMNPLSNRCCQHNHSHGWPYFTENLWQATGDNGLAAAIYSASEVTAKVGQGTSVTITESTNYPFEETLRFTVEPDKAETFPLYFRIPGWCENPSVRVAGQSLPIKSGAKGYIRIEREWRSGDQIELTLPMPLKVNVWSKNHNSRSIDLGPLTFSLRIEERVTSVDSTKTAVHDARWVEGVDPAKWPSFEIHAASAWNYGLEIDPRHPEESFTVVRKAWPKSNFPFTLEDAPIMLRARGRQIPAWQVDRTGLVGELQDSPAQSREPISDLILVPMGAARLRISAFPEVSADGTPWTAPIMPLPYSPEASHVFGGDDLWAVCDQLVPRASADESVPRMTWWPHQGTEEWVSYDFGASRTIKGVDVFWFDDRGSGQCRVPKAWRVQIMTDGQWTDVRHSGEWGVKRDEFNTVMFEPVAAAKMRLLVQLQEGLSAGILEWRIRV